ncbi:MAG TPA: hypothetical protein VE956_02320 [Nodularia sp. (in: cyanobacteria)]|nr:hypothetical protein [Nodularia sp. (in: cyanobacteria)]
MYTQNQVLGYLQVARSITDLDQHLAYLRLALVLGLPISMIFVGLSSWWLAGRAMQPVRFSHVRLEKRVWDTS